MPPASEHKIPLNIAVLTVSDTRSLSEDSSGDYLAESLKEAGHELAGYGMANTRITAHL